MIIHDDLASAIAIMNADKLVYKNRHVTKSMLMFPIFLDVENEPSTGVYYVGRGSYPNVNGIVQLDAGIMRGEDHAIGAVCALEG